MAPVATRRLPTARFTSCCPTDSEACASFRPPTIRHCSPMSATTSINTMSFIGIDIGANFLKGAWLNLRSETLGDVRREPFPAFTAGLPPGRREVPVDLILTQLERLVRHLLGQRPGPCAGLLICGQMHGLVLTRRDGSPAGNFISWQDTRILETGTDGRTHAAAHRNHFGPISRFSLPPTVIRDH
jgi:hypothetical protein